MIHKGDKIKIRRTRELILEGLGSLSNKTGVITELMLKNKTPGVIVKLNECYGESRYWFIPIQSVETESMKSHKDKLRTLNEKIF